MDLTGGNNPATPKLDTTPQPQGPPSMDPNNISVGAPMTAPPVMPGGVEQVPPQVPQQQPMMPPQAPVDMTGAMDMNTSSEPSGPADGKGKIVAMIAIGGVLILGLVAGAFFVGNTMGKSEGRKAADAEYQRMEAERQRMEAEEKEAQQAPLELGADLVDPKYVDEVIEGEIGKQLTAGDGFVLKVTNIERNFQPDDPNYKLDEAKELVKVNFLMGNIAKDKAKDMTSFAFYIEDSTGARVTPENVADFEGKFDSVKLDPGSQSAGSIVYLVNKDDAPLKFAREQRYRFSGQNKEVTTQTVVTIAK